MARSQRALAEHLNTRFAELKRIRHSWEPGWRDIARYQIPQRGDFLRTAGQSDRGTKKNQAIIDMVAHFALRGAAQKEIGRASCRERV